jgi:tagatose-1,6-bisphosphate aldolase non-catalytic subunit AgaZ/GatZ
METMNTLLPLDVPSRLGVGPMSANCVDAVIDVAARNQRPIMLIPSRRQVEMSELGGGYVEGWTPADLMAYVRTRDTDRLVLVCRDHGGPWQHPTERAMSEDEAMQSSLDSFKEDVASGFDLLHIDTCLEGEGVASVRDAIDRLVLLYAETQAYAQNLGRKLMFEIGFEDQGVDTNEPRVFRAQIAEVMRRLDVVGLPRPAFIVAQTATKVRETENDGALTYAPAAVGHTIRELADVCHSHGSALKTHNADYLSAEALRHLAANGVSALNVAPEFGVVETRTLLGLMKEAGLSRVSENFLSLAFDSGRWRKWMKQDTKATDLDRAVVAGHYVFGTEEFRELKKQLAFAYDDSFNSVDKRLRTAIGHAVQHYLTHFHLPVRVH